MAVFSVNQATQMYVGNATKKTTSTDEVYYVIGTESTDRIPAGGLIYESTPAAISTFNDKAPHPIITVAGTVAVGDEYIVRLIIEGDTGMSNAYIKTVGVVAEAATTASLASSIKTALETAAKRDIEADYSVSLNSSAVTITPIPHHTVGKRYVLPRITVEVVCVKGTNLGKDVKWVNENVKAVSGTGLMKMKDLEYFCAGEKGDQYRGAGYPNEFTFTSKLTAESALVNVIHYAESGSNEAVQKSEKTIIIVGTISAAS